ncbi:uncharacterized protein LOC123882304 [Trifolium pratense]|uniref:uncharacterized protein LOC123882304 n=1 Tax=Trifolium pratense TaxID=57577 RepID=UPI001E6948C8|nr:uncharacterized protein LOC123882304 [Trifolium pratense]
MIEDGSMERQQTRKNNYVGNGSLKAKEQPRKRVVVSGDESRVKEKPLKRIVVEDDSRARQESARKKSKRTPLCPSMLIDDYLKKNGKDVENEIRNLIEDEGDIVMEELEENVDCEEAAETNETTKKRTRGPTLCLKIYARSLKQREEVTLDDDGDVIGPDDKTVAEFANFLGSIARNSDFCPLIYTNF